jgi:hypothetical protein
MEIFIGRDKNRLTAARPELIEVDAMMQVDMDRIYKNMPLEKIPWNKETPPEALYQVAFICISLLSPRHTPRRRFLVAASICF